MHTYCNAYRGLTMQRSRLMENKEEEKKNENFRLVQYEKYTLGTFGAYV